ncbi:DUF2975 domain-containing protein [Saccharothrix yanglingensis]|uniref:DUF2975 domain-containing protein n=1 Tax=Saccharothrix yanglingensis TaxID=659496 RepID=A0ABU0X510_9PSEU|nr:DUF2975 domain-containing protein [Saccharothrix yanglingensis]MDQ2587231.1 hypothetical protein [Saccharothrix yanglingensis]
MTSMDDMGDVVEENPQDGPLAGDEGRKGRRRPLGALIGVVRFTWAAAVVCAGLAVVSAISVASAASVCFTSDLGTHVLTSVEQGRAHLGAQSLRICVDDPTTWERVLVAVERGLPVTGYAALLYLLLRLLERTARDGLRTAATADRVRRLGWATLVVPLLTTLTKAVVRIEVVKPVVPELSDHYGSLPMVWDVPWWAVVAGAGLLALARITRTGAEVRRDLEGTV